MLSTGVSISDSRHIFFESGMQGVAINSVATGREQKASDKVDAETSSELERQLQKAKSGLVEQLDTQFALHPLSRDESDTCNTLLKSAKNSDICVLPTHNINVRGEMEGFRFTVPSRSPGETLPITHTMFFGHTATECISDIGPVNKQVIELLSDIPRCRQLMRELLEEINSFTSSDAATFDCIPENVDAFVGTDKAGNPTMATSTKHKSIDAKPWKPDMPTRIGIYHAYTRGFNKDSREHKLFIVCSGGCSSVCDSYYNLLLDVAEYFDVNQVAEAQETWWLRRACYRARCRLIKMVADKFKLNVQSIKDIHAYDQKTQMAVSTIDTLCHDIQRLKSGHVAIFNECADTTATKNGILNMLQPSEGMWLFKGPPRSSLGISTYGGVFGHHGQCGIFPTGTFEIHHPNTENKLNAKLKRRPASGSHKHAVKTAYSSVLSRDTQHVVRLSNPKNTDSKTPHTAEYMCYDEGFIKNLETMQWNRDNGIIELMPIIVGIP